MNVYIVIRYKADARVLQRGTFPLKNKQPQEVAFNWWKQIKKEMHVQQLEKVLCDGEDITEIIKKMEMRE